MATVVRDDEHRQADEDHLERCVADRDRTAERREETVPAAR